VTFALTHRPPHRRKNEQRYGGTLSHSIAVDVEPITSITALAPPRVTSTAHHPFYNNTINNKINNYYHKNDILNKIS